MSVPSPCPAQSLQADVSYRLGPDDQLAIRALHAPEISDKPARIDAEGYLRLPMIGRVRAAGLTVGGLEEELASRLARYIDQPEVSVHVLEFRSQPVSILGAVKNPGVHQTRGRQSLIEVLSLAGGLDADAGHSVRIARRREWGPIPLPNTQTEGEGVTVAEVSVEDVLSAGSPAANLVMRAHDTVTVSRAKMVYVIGEVRRSGGFLLRERETLSVLQALSLAEGLLRTAAPQKARILRPKGPGAERDEIPVNLSRILSGKASDMPLQPQDVFFIPNSAAKSAVLRSVEAAIQMGTGVVIWRR